MGPKTQKMIRLAQSLQQKWQLGDNDGEYSDTLINAPAEDGYCEKEEQENRKD